MDSAGGVCTVRAVHCPRGIPLQHALVEGQANSGAEGLEYAARIEQGLTSVLGVQSPSVPTGGGVASAATAPATTVAREVGSAATAATFGAAADVPEKFCR